MKAEIIEQEKSPKASLFIDNDNTIIIMAQEVGNFYMVQYVFQIQVHTQLGIIVKIGAQRNLPFFTAK